MYHYPGANVAPLSAVADADGAGGDAGTARTRAEGLRERELQALGRDMAALINLAFRWQTCAADGQQKVLCGGDSGGTLS